MPTDEAEKILIPERMMNYLELSERILKADVDPRIIAIVGVAFVDDGLREIVEMAMPGLNADLRKKIFTGYGPLATLSARTDIARALGILGHEQHRLIHLLTKVRNTMAHELHAHDFDHPAISAIIDKMEITVLGEDGQKVETRTGGSGDQPRWSFYQMCLMGVANSIQITKNRLWELSNDGRA